MRWLTDPLFRRALLLAVALGGLRAIAGALVGSPDSWQEGVTIVLEIMVGAAAMRLWTWKDEP